MSDLVQGILIGGLTAIFGGAASGALALIINRQQNKAALEQLNLKLQFDAKEARINRVIKARDYLNDLKRRLLELELLLYDLQYNANNLVKKYRENGQINEATMQRIHKTADEVLVQEKEFIKLIGQPSDAMLCELLEKKRQNDLAAMDVMQTFVLFFDNKDNLGKPFPDNVVIPQEIHINLMREISRRIEQLLCG
ncbi:MAG: hypothetical protein ABSD79_05120, partial [Dehalococcoidales bacterium]